MKTDRFRRIMRAALVAVSAFLVCASWAFSQWLHVTYRTPSMLLWLVAAPLFASILTFSTLASVRTLLPKRPIGFVTSFVAPVLHIAFTYTIATLLSQQSSPIVQLSDPQRIVAIWKYPILLLTIGGLEVVIVGFIASADQLLLGPQPKSKTKV